MLEAMYRELVFRMFLNILHMKIIDFPILPNDTILVTAVFFYHDVIVMHMENHQNSDISRS